MNVSSMTLATRPVMTPTFASRNSEDARVKKLSRLRDELTEQFPGNYSNGSGIGFVSDNFETDKRIGIVVYSETAKDSQQLVAFLTSNRLITATKEKQIFTYKGELVKFKVIGRIVAQ